MLRLLKALIIIVLVLQSKKDQQRLRWLPDALRGTQDLIRWALMSPTDLSPLVVFQCINLDCLRRRSRLQVYIRTLHTILNIDRCPLSVNRNTMFIDSRLSLGTVGGPAPDIDRTLHLRFCGDWGQANFHRVCAWLTQEVCDHAGRGSTVTTTSMADGGLGAIKDVHDGNLDLCIVTPSAQSSLALTGEGLFKRTGPMPKLCAIGTLPQRDRMVLAVHPKYGVKSWEDIHRVKPPLRIVTSTDDGTSFIGYLATRFLEAHGLTRELLGSWGGEIIDGGYRPEQSTDKVLSGEVDCLLQEAIMIPWWSNLIQTDLLIPIPAQPSVLAKLGAIEGLGPATIRGGFWKNVPHELLAMDFSDFAIVVSKDMPDDVAALLSWIFINTSAAFEVQYLHIPSERSPLTWPLDPKAMATTHLPLHPAAEKWYGKAELL